MLRGSKTAGYGTAAPSEEKPKPAAKPAGGVFSGLVSLLSPGSTSSESKSFAAAGNGGYGAAPASEAPAKPKRPASAAVTIFTSPSGSSAPSYTAFGNNK